MLSVNQQSREVALESLVQIFYTNAKSPPIWINAEVDTVFLDVGSNGDISKVIKEWHFVLTIAEFRLIQRLDIGVYLKHNDLADMLAALNTVAITFLADQARNHSQSREFR